MLVAAIREIVSNSARAATANSMSKAVQQRVPVRDIGVLIVEDHILVRSGLCALLKSQLDIHVVGEATDGESGVSQALRLVPDILLLDLSLPRKSGMQVLRELSGSNFHGKTIVLTASINREQIVEAVQLGARGVVMKDLPPELFFKSIRSVMAGQYWLDRSSVSDLAQQLHSLTRQSAVAGHQAAFGLTAREFQIISGVLAGYSNKDIAEKLSISDQTVKNHIRAIFDKLGVSSRLELALFAMKRELVEPM